MYCKELIVIQRNVGKLLWVLYRKSLLQLFIVSLFQLKERIKLKNTCFVQRYKMKTFKKKSGNSKNNLNIKVHLTPNTISAKCKL